MTITAHVRDHRIVLPDDLSVPEGTEVQITLPDSVLRDASALTAQQAELLAAVEALHGSITLPAHLSDKELIAEARAGKYGC